MLHLFGLYTHYYFALCAAKNIGQYFMVVGPDTCEKS